MPRSRLSISLPLPPICLLGPVLFDIQVRLPRRELKEFLGCIRSIRDSLDRLGARTHSLSAGRITFPPPGRDTGNPIIIRDFHQERVRHARARRKRPSFNEGRLKVATWPQHHLAAPAFAVLYMTIPRKQPKVFLGCVGPIRDPMDGLGAWTRSLSSGRLT
jgi:hypothetical protein